MLCTEKLPINEPPLINNKCTKENCQSCSNSAIHLEKAKNSRKVCVRDGETVAPDMIVRSVDLQDMVMWPQLPKFNSACISSQLCTREMLQQQE